MKFNAYRIHRKDKTVHADFEDMDIQALTQGDVLIKVAWSSVNYKDALAATGKGRILRQYPLNGGIDLSGTVERCDTDAFQPGDKVLVCGGLLSEMFDGGFSEYARVPSDIVVPMPSGLSLKEAMSLGTAGFSAALAVSRLLENGQRPDHGPILVTGATGGVGSYSICLLKQLGFSVTAMTGKTDQKPYLELIGADKVVSREELSITDRPMETPQWGGVIDSVGGETLSQLTKAVVPWGNIASVGLAGGIGLETTVLPFILRGVSLLGVNSIEMPSDRRQAIWQKLGDTWKPDCMDTITTQQINFDQLPEVFDQYMQGSMIGRTIVAIDKTQ